VFNASTSALKSWQTLKEFANPVPPITQVPGFAYNDPLLPQRVRSLAQKLSNEGLNHNEITSLLGLCKVKKYQVMHGLTRLNDVAYLKIIALEFGLVRKATGLANAEYFPLGKTEPLSLEEGEEVFNHIMGQIHQRLDLPPKNDLKYRTKLLRYRTGLSNRELGKLVYTRANAQFRAETSGECGIDAGIAVCKALNINPYWLAAGVKQIKPFRMPALPKCGLTTLRITSICTPYTLARKNSIRDKHLVEKVAELQGKLGTNFYSLLRTSPQSVRRWMGGGNATSVTLARVRLALSNIFQSDTGFYLFQNNRTSPVPDALVLSRLTPCTGAKYVRDVNAGKHANNAFTSYRACMARETAKISAQRQRQRQRKQTKLAA
jgi:hypothetical protein